jgi:predicted permease
MSVVRLWVARVIGSIRTARGEREFADELEAHVQLEADEYVRRGLAPAEARRMALARSGGLEAAKDAARDQRGLPAIDQLAQDLRYAIRTLRRGPGFSLVVVAMLALGIGANTAIFSLIEAVVVRGLPVPHPEQLVAIGDPSLVNSTGEGSPHATLFSYPLYRDVRDRGGLFTGVLASGPTGRLDVLADSAGAELEHPRGRFVSANYFSVLGVPALRGHVFDGSEDQTAGSAPVATISYAYWTSRFHQDASVVGRSIVVDNSRMTIIGVTPPSFTGEVVGESTDLWLPASMHDVLQPNNRKLEKRKSSWLLLLGRLAPGATLEQARQELGPFIIRTIVANAPGRAGEEFLARNPRAYIDPGSRGFSEVRDTFQAPLFTLMIGVALLLCIICANVANLLLARAIARGREMAVRLALGAERGRLVRQLLTESALLAGLGATIGLLLAWWGSRALLVLASDGSPIPLDLSLDPRVVAFTLTVSCAAVILFGLVPALRASRVDYASTLRANARTVTGGMPGGRRASLGNLLIGGQVALSVVLLVGAAMLTRSLHNVQSTDVGLDRDHLVMLDVDITARGYRRERLATLAHTMRERLVALPGVNAVTYSENGIFAGTDWHTSLQLPGFPMRAAGDSEIATDNVGPEYARGIGGHLVAGRDMAASDEDQASRVALVNQSFAKFYFPGQSAIGKQFHIEDTMAIQIVGVIADTHDHDLEHAPNRRAYFAYSPLDSLGSNPQALRFAIRTSGDPAAIVEQVRKAVVSVDPLLPIDGINPLPVLMRQSIREERLVAHLASGFGALALLLASIGLYGVMSYAISRRTGEIGLRSALGAQRVDVLRLVLTDAMRLVAAGMLVGVPLAVASMRLLRAQLHGVAVADPISIVVALAVLAASAVTAALLPAWRASRVSPLVALQAD